MHAYSFISLLSRLTRVKQQSATLIEDMFTNKHDDVVNTFQCLIYTDISDHNLIIQMDYSVNTNYWFSCNKKEFIANK